MKTLIVLTLLFIMGLETVNAQYKINKTNYDYKTWTYLEGDPYNPVTCGFLSIIPGVGQMAAHEYLRGAAFLGGAVGSFGLFILGVFLEYGYNDIGGPIAFVGLLGIPTIIICSIVDATRVAKVNNLVLRDINQGGFNLQLEPYILPVQSHESIKTQLGISLKVNF